MRAWGLALGCVVAACSPELVVSGDADIRCDNGRPCPDGLACLNESRCIDPALIDTLGPAMLSPVEGATVEAANPVFFVWREVAGAKSYVLTVAADPELTQPLAGTPVRVAVTNAELELPEGVVYWTVIADVTDAASRPPSRPLTVLGSTLHVYCPANTACVAGDDEKGLPGAPYRSINRALTAAAALRIRRVAVAHRGNDVPYDESITVISRIDLEGGYDPTFTSVTGRTPIIGNDVPLFAARVSERTRIAHFAFRSTARQRASTVIRLIGCSTRLELVNIGVSAERLNSDLIRVENSVDGGPILADSSIEALYPTSGNDDLDDLAAVSLLNGGDMQMARVTVDARPSANIFNFAAIRAQESVLDIEDSIITVRNGAAIRAIDAVSGSRLGMRRTAVTVTNANYEAIGVSAVDVASTDLAANTIDVSAAADVVRGVVISTGTVPAFARIASNVVRARDARTSLGIEAGATSVIANNTIVMEATERADGISINRPMVYVAMLNNIIVASSDTCTGTAPCIIGVREGPAGGQASVFLHNALVGFEANAPETCRYGVPNFSATVCLDDPNAPRTPTPTYAPRTEQNISPTTLAAISIPMDTLRPAQGSSIAALGYDTNATDCTTTPPHPATGATAPSCGSVLTDRDGRPRPVPPALGAYEPLAQ